MSALRQAFNQTDLRLRLWGDFAMIALLVMESFWITDWYDVLAHPKAGWLTTDIFIVVVLFLSHILARTAAHFRLSINWRRGVIVAWLVAAITAGFPILTFAGEGLTLIEIARKIGISFTTLGSDLIEFWHILLLLLIVLHAVRLAREPLQVYTSRANFQLGLFLLLLYGLLFSWNKPAQAIITTYGFLFCGIAAMSAARISTLSEQRGGRLPRLQFTWLVGILSTAAVVVGIAVMLGWFTTNIASEAVALAFTILFSIMLLIGLVVFSPILLLILALGPTLMNLLDTLSRITLFAEMMKFASEAAKKIGITPEWIEAAAQTTKPFALIGILAGVVVLILVTMVWKPWQRRLLAEETASTLPLRAALRFPRLLFKRFSGRLPSGSRILAAARIRRAYAQLMELSSRLGKPRLPSATPLEFLPVLQTLFPGEEQTLHAITQAYLQVRYGELPETYEEVQLVLLGWERIKIQGKRLQAEQKRLLKRK